MNRKDTNHSSFKILRIALILSYFIVLIAYLYFIFIAIKEYDFLVEESILTIGVTLIFLLFSLSTWLTSRLSGIISKIDHSLRSDEYSSEIELGNILSSNYADGLIRHFQIIRDASKQKSEYQFLQQQAQLDAMQSQINPHFLYNALDSIRGLALEQGAKETANMAEALSSMFRYSISQSGDLQTLEQELDNVENYMKIQQYRFNNRFNLTIDIDMKDNRVASFLLPKLTLQPIIENAIYHGFDTLPNNNMITIKAYPTQSRLIISVSDNGIGMDEPTLLALNKKLLEGSFERIVHNNVSPAKKSSGIALVNVNSRIKMLFGDSFGLTAYSTKGIGTEVQITLPLVDRDSVSQKIL